MRKKVIGTLNKCYSLSLLDYHGSRHILVAAEKTDPCVMFDLEGNAEETIWEGPGGTMSMVPLPGTDGQFLATQYFYSPNDSTKAAIMIVTPRGKNEWQVRKLVDLPFVHRFDIIQKNGIYYLIACTIKSAHQYRDDWSSPGAVYAAVLPEDLSAFDENNQLQLSLVQDGMQRNHGYARIQTVQGEAALIACENGIYCFNPPDAPDGVWQIEKLLDDAASDAVLADLDGDGVDEIVSISPFHGDTLAVYKKTEDSYIKVFEYPEKLDFLHAICIAPMKDKLSVIIGNRGGERKLLRLTYEAEEGYAAELLDQGAGAANVLHYVHDGKDVIAAANRETNEIALYEFEV